MHLPWCMPWSLTSGFLWSQWGRKRSRHSRCMHRSKRHMWINFGDDRWFCCWVSRKVYKQAEYTHQYCNFNKLMVSHGSYWNMNITLQQTNSVFKNDRHVCTLLGDFRWLVNPLVAMICYVKMFLSIRRHDVWYIHWCDLGINKHLHLFVNVKIVCYSVYVMIAQVWYDSFCKHTFESITLGTDRTMFYKTSFGNRQIE